MPLTSKTPSRLLALVLPVLAILVAGCASQPDAPSLYPPGDVTSQGAATRGLYNVVFLIAAIIFFAVEGTIVWIVLRYRRKATDTELPSQFHGNNLIEVIWTVIPTAIVLFLFVVSWQTLNTVEAKDPNPAVRVVANAQRFAWSFSYVDANGESLIKTPDGKPVLFYGTLEVPPGVPVDVKLHSPDVIHAFYVPKFLFKRDVVPGVTNEFDFTVDPGDAGQTFRGQCAELCGIGHGGMTFEVHARASLADFQTWLQQQIAQASGAPGASAGAPSGSPAASSAAPSASPAASSFAPSASPAAGGASLQLAASNSTFDKNALEAPAGQAFTITFANNDPGTMHNVEILNPDGSVAFKGDFVTGINTATYQVTALPAGTYQFRCLVHPGTMTGTLTVK